ncbi:MAG: aspartate-semialdehyde dehydrogenase [Candidatus Electryonea clarkiae]|nr:aspartate-semialdehyde dehydrogenase [Candidatus Electryonea clarkiae]MDP8287385.1 aspartate-semialdehyde dehydrogenase [Candidatus Electryonea clarkiae]
MDDKLKIGIVGATGLVGQTAIEVLNERSPENCEFSAYATERIKGRMIAINESVIHVETYPSKPPDLDYALFCAPNEVAKTLVPEWRNAGIRIIDNSSVFRLDAAVPLVVPEVNSSDISDASGLIANPNCSTIQLAVVLEPLHKAFGIKRVSVATYQSVSGAGAEAVEQWENEIAGETVSKSPFPRPIHANVIPQIGEFNESGFTSEEAKLMKELKKILHLDNIPISATAVRVPVRTGHSEAVEVSLNGKPDLKEVSRCFTNKEGLVVSAPGEYHTPLEIAGSNEVFISRIREHPDEKGTFLFWVVADNLRKGAATNAVQIMEKWIVSGE